MAEQESYVQDYELVVYSYVGKSEHLPHSGSFSGSQFVLHSSTEKQGFPDLPPLLSEDGNENRQGYFAYMSGVWSF